MRALSNQTPEMPESDGGFVDLPGTHINVRSAGGTKREYVRNDGTVLATSHTHWRRNPLYPNPRVTVEGVVFEERLLGKRRNNHMRTPREVVNLDTKKRVFLIDGMNFNGKANAVIRLSEERWYSFPMEGTRKENPVMTAVDETGKQVALWWSSSDPYENRYRRNRDTARGSYNCASGDDCHGHTIFCVLFLETGRLTKDCRRRRVIPDRRECGTFSCSHSGRTSFDFLRLRKKRDQCLEEPFSDDHHWGLFGVDAIGPGQ